MNWNCCDIDGFGEDVLQRAYQALSPSRKEHIDKLRQPQDKRRSLAAEVLVQKMLRQYYNIDWAVLHRTPQGQPFLTGCSLCVSISHCENMVACAIDEKAVGIDIERIRPVNLKICNHVCTEEEKRYVLGDLAEFPQGNCDDPQMLRRFFEIWTAKEAFFKRNGTGITDLRSVNIQNIQRQMHTIGDYLLQII